MNSGTAYDKLAVMIMIIIYKIKLPPVFLIPVLDHFYWFW